MWIRMRQMLEMIRFSHTIFALPFALLAAVMAWRVPTADGASIEFRWRDLLGILVCMVCARSAAMAFNRLADKDLDSQNPRTWQRHLPAGVLSVTSVAVFAAVASVGFVPATCIFFPNRLPVAAIAAGSRVSVWLQLCQTLHIARPFLARHRPDDGSRFSLDRVARSGGSAELRWIFLPAATLGLAVLAVGRGIRHDLRLSGRGV